MHRTLIAGVIAAATIVAGATPAAAFYNPGPVVCVRAPCPNAPHPRVVVVTTTAAAAHRHGGYIDRGWTCSRLERNTWRCSRTVIRHR